MRAEDADKAGRDYKVGLLMKFGTRSHSAKVRLRCTGTGLDTAQYFFNSRVMKLFPC